MEKELKSILFKTFLTIICVLGGVFLLAKFAKDPILEYASVFVKTFGVPGLFFGMLLSDALPAFVPPDAFLLMALAGKMNEVAVIISTGFGSVIGGSIAYAIGYYLIPRIQIGKKFLMEHEEKLLPYVRKYGFGAVVLAALTPIPYSWMSYTVGTFKMNFFVFVLGSLFRFVRLGGYFYAMKLGWILG